MLDMWRTKQSLHLSRLGLETSSIFISSSVFTNEVLVFDKNVDGLVHYLEILSDDIFYYSWQKLVMAAGPSFINISPYTETDWIQTENLSQQSAQQNILRSKTY